MCYKLWKQFQGRPGEGAGIITEQSIGLDERLAGRYGGRASEDTETGRQLAVRPASGDPWTVMAGTAALGPQRVAGPAATPAGLITPVDLALVENDRINGAYLASQVETFCRVYADWPSELDLVLTTLFIMMTWLRKPDDSPSLNVLPRWGAIGVQGSGKTRMMEIIDALCYKSSGIMGNLTSAYVRDVMAEHETLLADETQRLFRSGGGKIEIQQAFTAHKDTVRSGNGHGGKNNRSLFGFIAYAARPSIITATGGLEDGALADIFSRTLPLVFPEPSARLIPDQDRYWDVLSGALSKRLEVWGKIMSPRPDESNPKGNLWPVHPVPAGIGTGRKREIVLPYLALADHLVNPRVLDEEGRDTRWAERARNLLTGHARPDEPDELMALIADSFRAMGVDVEEE